MKVLVTGLAWHDNTPAIATNGFQKLGHETEIFYDNAPHWTLTASKIARRSPFLRGAQRLEDQYRENTARLFLKKISAYKPDFIFVIAGCRFPRTAIELVRRKWNIPIVNFVVDDPAFCSRTLLHDFGAYTKVFVIDTSWIPVIEFFNPGNVRYLPHAGDTLHFKRLGIKKEIDIAFGGTVGLRMPNGPSGYLRATLLHALALRGFRIRAYANGIQETFREFPKLRTIEYYDGYKNHADLNLLYNQAKVALSIHSPQLKRGVSPRVFDIALSGTFQLVEYKPDLPQLFQEGVRWFRNTEELVTLAEQYLRDDDAREELAKKAHTIAREKHDFANRAREILTASEH